MTRTQSCLSRNNDGDGARPLKACSTEVAKVMSFLPRGLLHSASPSITVTSQSQMLCWGQHFRQVADVGSDLTVLTLFVQLHFPDCREIHAASAI